MTYPLSQIEGMTPFAAAKLKKLGIRTTEALLEAARTVKGRKELAAKSGFSEQQLLEWANICDYMRIPGMGKAKTLLLRAAGLRGQRVLKADRSNEARPRVVKSARTSPMTLANLKPCPEHGLAISTLACSGCLSIQKCSSGVFV